MDAGQVFLTICGMAAVTYASRSGPLLFLAGRNLPPGLVRFLAHVPAAVLAALVAPVLFAPEGNPAVGPARLFVWAGLAALALALRTRGLFGPVALGMGLVAAARYYWGF